MTLKQSKTVSANHRICKSATRVVAFLSDGTNRIFDNSEGQYVVISTFTEREDATSTDRFAQQLNAKRKKLELQPPGSQRLPGLE